MNKHRYAKVILFGIVLTAVFWYGWTQAQPANSASAEQKMAGSESEPKSTSEDDRNNPFTNLLGSEKPTAQKISQTSQLVEEKPELFVETVTLKFLEAQNLRSAIAKMSSENGSISIDSKSNSLIVCDTKENLEKIIAKIKQVDRKPDQVMIEVVLLDVKLNNETEIGVNWDMLTQKYNIKLDSSSGFGTSFRQNLTSTRVASVDGTDIDNIGNATAFNSVIGTGSDFALLFGEIRTIIHALQEKNNVEIIASPRVMVVSGKEASIEAVEEIPYQELSQTSQGGEMTSTQFKNVGVTLTVGATLTEDKFILLDVQADQKVRTGTLSAVPVVDARVVKSSLLLEDGQVLVIGGLRRKETQKQTEQVPILGDIPLIGLAFRDTIVTQNSSELLILLSPHIYKGQAPDDAQMAKFNEITQRPFLTVPEVAERKAAEEKEKARIEKEAERKSKKAKDKKK
jgi:type II secretory pathway component GspD/PulD (secretin)